MFDKELRLKLQVFHLSAIRGLEFTRSHSTFVFLIQNTKYGLQLTAINKSESPSPCKAHFPYNFVNSSVQYWKHDPISVEIKYIYTGCNRRNGPDFGRVFRMLNYTEKPQNTYIQSWTVWEIMASEVWNFDSCYTLTDYQIRIETGRNMWFL